MKTAVGTEEEDTTAEAVVQRTDDIKGTGSQVERWVVAEGGA